MNAIIIHDDFELAAKTNGFLGHVMPHADKTAQWHVKPWLVNLLALKGIADAALSDAVDAHLIVLALHQSESLPACLPGWLEQWAVCRQVQDAALAVWDGGEGGKLSSTTTPELARFAQHHGLSFMYDNGTVESESAGFMSHLHEREVAQTPTLMPGLEQPVQGYHQHWGINE
jgi:hypothetical protein